MAQSPGAFSTELGSLISHIILTIGTSYTLQQTGAPNDLRSIHASLGILCVNAGLGVLTWCTEGSEISNFYWETYMLRRLLFVAGLNSELYLKNGFDSYIAYLHFVPGILVPIFDYITDIDTAPLTEICIIGNILSCFYITYTTGNDSGLFAAGLALISMALHWILSTLDKENVNVFTFREIDFHNLLLTGYAFCAAKSI